MFHNEKVAWLLTKVGYKKEVMEMQKNIINKIKETLEDMNMPCEWRVEWFKQKHMIEIVVMIPVAMPLDERVSDQYGTVNSHDQFVFEETILLFDSRLAEIKNDNYLLSIPFDKEDGLYGGTIQALCKTLRLSVVQAISDLNEFIHDNQTVLFEMKWHNDNYLSTIKTMKDLNRFDYVIYSYPSDITEKVVDENEVE